MRELTILIVSYNARGDLEQCLKSLRTSPPKVDHDIVVIDNASTDDSQTVAKAYAPMPKKAAWPRLIYPV